MPITSHAIALAAQRRKELLALVERDRLTRSTQDHAGHVQNWRPRRPRIVLPTQAAPTVRVLPVTAQCGEGNICHG
jgi:hypothetical protein